MSYDEYLDAGGTHDDLVAAIEHFFLDNQTDSITDRRLFCSSNRERNAVLQLLSGYSCISLGFKISDFSDMNSWNCIYYTEPGVIHSGKHVREMSENEQELSDIYKRLLGDTLVQSHECELPDIMTLFEPVC